MRVTGTFAAADLKKELAGHVCSCKGKRVITAETPKGDIKDEAKQAACTYWMMGWSWDEIETILHDSEYKEDVITYAMKEAKAYAKKILNEGPFANMVAGQGIKLSNGYVGVVENIYADHINVRVANEGIIKVGSAYVDSDATANLRKAYDLRIESSNMIAKANARVVPILNKAATRIRASDAVLTPINELLSRLGAMQSASKSLKTEAAKFHTAWRDQHTVWEAQSPEELEFAQFVAAMITQETFTTEDITATLYSELSSALANLANVVNDNPTEVSVDNIISTHRGKLEAILNKVDGHTYEMTNKNASTRNYTQHFAKLDPDQDATGWTDSAIDWAKNAWNDTKEFNAWWTAEAKAEVTQVIEEIDNASRELKSAASSVAVTAALRPLV